MEQVIHVDNKDNQIGVGEKLETHQQGKLHRAFSIFILNANGEMLIQQRAQCKYHCPGLWANTCCGHPRPGETVAQAAHRRLQEEFGFDAPFEEKLSYVYKVAFDNGLTEHEFLHVFVGTADGVKPVPNPEEIDGWKWVAVADVKRDIVQRPEQYAYWFKLSVEKLFS
jgi:isopentenyl-diphosphate delta-isomerase